MYFLLSVSPRKEMGDHKAKKNCLTMAGFKPMTCGLELQLTYKARQIQVIESEGKIHLIQRLWA